MKILGLCHDVLMCSACVTVDGEVVAAIAEERLDRQKQSRLFPTRAISRCLEIAGLGLGEVDEIAVAWNPGIEMETVPSGYLTGRIMRSEHMLQVPAQLRRISGKGSQSTLSMADLWDGAPRSPTSITIWPMQGTPSF